MNRWAVFDLDVHMTSREYLCRLRPICRVPHGGLGYAPQGLRRRLSPLLSAGLHFSCYRLLNSYGPDRAEITPLQWVRYVTLRQILPG